MCTRLVHTRHQLCTASSGDRSIVGISSLHRQTSVLCGIGRNRYGNSKHFQCFRIWCRMCRWR
uniref:Uncharacterized protein n=1 Tax=Anopheles funestus TaxID=62324 RepID=A0A182S0U3_ANOFN